MAECADHFRMRQRCSNDQAESRATEGEIEKCEHADRDRHHQHLVCRVTGAEEQERGEIDDGWHAILDRIAAPDHDHRFGHEIGEPEGKEYFGYMTLLVHVA